MITYSNLTKSQKIDLINHLRQERVRLLTEARKRKSKKTNTKKKKLPNLQFSSKELEGIFANMSISDRNKILK